MPLILGELMQFKKKRTKKIVHNPILTYNIIFAIAAL